MAMRRETFRINGREICYVTQHVSTVDFTLLAPELDWWAWSGQKDPATVRAIAQAFSAAADLLEQWLADTGKPYDAELSQ